MNLLTLTTRRALLLAIFLFSLFNLAHAQEIPNGDGDLLWERPLNGRTVNDAKFHPTNGNIIAAVNHEIWEIDPKDGHTIRVFEGGYPADENDVIRTINITSDGQRIVTGGAMGKKGILIWDYNTGLVNKIISKNEVFDGYENIGIYPDNNRIIFNTYQNDYNAQFNILYINIYDLQKDSIIKRLNLTNTYCSRFRLSDNGQFIAYHFGRGTPGDFYDNMELWDAASITKLQDLGKLSGDPNDIQFSNNNQYLGFSFTPGFLLFRMVNESYVRYLTIGYAKAFTLSFENTNLFLDFIGKSSKDNPPTYILNLKNRDSIYKYTSRIGSLLRINKNNELYTLGFDTVVGTKMMFYSNNWYEVGVNETPKIISSIININYSNDLLQINLSNIDVIDNLIITDILGKKLFIQESTPVINNQISIPLFLPSGNYLLKIVSNGKEYTSKFSVVR